MLWQGIDARRQVLHVVREPTHHQVFNLLLVFVVLGMHVHVDGHELRNSSRSAVLLQGFHVAIYHRQELQRVQLHAIVLHLHVEQVG